MIIFVFHNEIYKIVNVNSEEDHDHDIKSSTEIFK